MISLEYSPDLYQTFLLIICIFTRFIECHIRVKNLFEFLKFKNTLGKTKYDDVTCIEIYFK